MCFFIAKFSETEPRRFRKASLRETEHGRKRRQRGFGVPGPAALVGAGRSEKLSEIHEGAGWSGLIQTCSSRIVARLTLPERVGWMDIFLEGAFSADRRSFSRLGVLLFYGVFQPHVVISTGVAAIASLYFRRVY